jgi:hypothetical protein
LGWARSRRIVSRRVLRLIEGDQVPYVVLDQRISVEEIGEDLRLHLESVKAYPSIAVNVRMIDWSYEPNMRRLERISVQEMSLHRERREIPIRNQEKKIEDPIGVRRVLWSNNLCMNLIPGLSPPCGDARPRVPFQLLQLLPQTTQKHFRHTKKAWLVHSTTAVSRE